MHRQLTIKELLDWLAAEITRHGLSLLDGRGIGNISFFRPLDFAAALNRLRGIKVIQAR
jgi:hypothetical protein